MHAEWSVECGAEDPVLVVPWTSGAELSDVAASFAFVDLRTRPNAVDSIPEAEAHPPLLRTLRTLNAMRSPVFTAKCDAWEMDADEIAQSKLDLGIENAFEISGEAGAPVPVVPDALAFGFASYVDCVVRDRSLFASFPRHEHLLRGVTRLAAQPEHPHSVLECVLRPAFVHLEAPRQGYAFSIYVKSLGESPQRAWKSWAAALSDVTGLLRRNDVVR
jgi:hypothetical protein